MAGSEPGVNLKIRDYLIWSVINLIILNPILGLIAVIFSVRSRTAFGEGKISPTLNQWNE